MKSMRSLVRDLSLKFLHSCRLVPKFLGETLITSTCIIFPTLPSNQKIVKVRIGSFRAHQVDIFDSIEPAAVNSYMVISLR